MKNQQPSDLEMQVLSMLWKHGPSTVRNVLTNLPDGKQRAYTTVLTIMQGMEKKKLVSRVLDGTAHVYRPEINRQDVGKPVIKRLLQNLFASDPAKIVQAMVDADEVSETDLKEIRRVLNKAARDAKQRGTDS